MVDPPSSQSGSSQSIDGYFDNAVKKAIGQTKKPSAEPKLESKPAKDTLSRDPEERSASRNFPALSISSKGINLPQTQELEPIEIFGMGTIQRFRVQNPDGSITEYFRNNTYVPLEVKVEFTGENFVVQIRGKQITDKNAKGNPQVIRMPSRKPGEASPEIVAYKVQTRDVNLGECRFGYNPTPAMFGTSEGSKYNDKSLYSMPFPKGVNWRITQGHDNPKSHKGKNVYALDLVTDERDKDKFVSAARGGIVIKIKEDSKNGGPTAHPINDNNEIWILHNDGSIGKYGHLQAGSITKAKLKLGDRVDEGQIIASYGKSGNYDGLEHLHFQVDFPEGTKGVKPISIKDCFKGRDGRLLGHSLKEGISGQ